jgi:nitrogen fixation NifU-like protein
VNGLGMSDGADIRDLYQAVILDHGRHPRHAGRPDRFDATARGDNPLCGDRVQVWLSYGMDGRIGQASFDARGCAISVASADLMAEEVAGRTPAEARATFARFRDMAKSGICPECDEVLQRLRPLASVHEYPSRVKCATLPWHALLAALDGEGQASSE